MKNIVKKILKIGSDNPKLRAMVLVLVIAVIGVLVWSWFQAIRSEPITEGASSVASIPADLSSAGVAGQQTPAYRKAVQEYNIAQQKATIGSGQSFIPLPVDNSAGVVPSDNSSANATQVAAANAYIVGLTQQARLSPSAAATLQALMDNPKTSRAEYAAALQQLVDNGTISQEDAANLLARYDAVAAARASNDPALLKAALAKQAQLVSDLGQQKKLPESIAQHLADLQASGISPEDYKKILQGYIKSGALSVGTAEDLLKHYVALNKAADALNSIVGSDQSSAQKTLLAQQALQAKQAEQVQQQQLAQAQAQAKEAAHQQEVQSLTASVTQQQNMLVKSWTTPVQQVEEALPPPAAAAGASAGETTGSEAGAAISMQPLIKDGEILYAKLDTAVDSDFPSTPVMATIVDGKFTGATLIGQLQTVHNGDRVMLVFTKMSKKDWPNTITVSAYAIDPNTARIAIASSVDHHYLSRYAGLFASSFLQGYGQTLQQSGTSLMLTPTGVNFIQSSLSPIERVGVGLGQIGQNLGNAAQENFNRPPTVTVDAGVGIGILFAAPVSAKTS